MNELEKFSLNKNLKFNSINDTILIQSEDSETFQKKDFRVVSKKKPNKLQFENLTLAPIEKDLISYNLLNKKEKEYLFNYHLNIYAKYSKLLNKRERKWLASHI